MGNPQYSEIKIVLFDERKRDSLLQAYVGSINYIKDLYPSTSRYPELGLRVSFNSLIGCKDGWYSEAMCIKIGTHKSSMPKPCLSISCSSTDDDSYLFINGMLAPLEKNSDESGDNTVVILAKRGKCCIEEIHYEMDYGTHRRVVMWDGTVVLDEEFADNEEDPAPPFLDVIEEHWEEYELKRVLNQGID